MPDQLYQPLSLWSCFYWKAKHLTSLKMRIFPVRPEDQVTVHVLEHPSTLKTLKHFFFDSSWRLQCINKDRSLAVSTAAQYSVAVKEPIPCEHSNTSFSLGYYFIRYESSAVRNYLLCGAETWETSAQPSVGAVGQPEGKSRRDRTRSFFSSKNIIWATNKKVKFD